MKEEPSASTSPVAEEEQKKEARILVLFRFVFVPLIIVAVVVAVIMFFGNMALKEKSVSDYLYDIKTGSQSERWQAAYHLSNLLANPKKDYTQEAKKHVPEMIIIFEKSKGGDPQIRNYLALALGRLQDQRAVPALKEGTNDPDSQTAIWSIWALGAIGDKEATPVIIEKLESPDSGIRIMSAYVLGALQDARAIPPLQAHLEDSSVEVSWNSAIALARMHDASGATLLQKMMRRDYLAGFPQISEEKKADLLITTIQASLKLDDPALQQQIKQVSTSDPNPRVRDTALKSLQ